MGDRDDIRQVHRIRSGDRVLLTVKDGYSPDELGGLAQQFKERFPDVEFTLLSGIEIAAIQSKEE